MAYALYLLGWLLAVECGGRWRKVGGRRKLVEVEAWVIYVRYYDVPCSNCAELRTDSANRAPESPVKLKGP